MAEQTTVPEPEPAAPAESGAGRVVVIDILRGLAILWVMTFHLWTDMTGGVLGVSPLYERLGERVREGNPLHALTALGELVLGSGYQGVAVFMMLSGLSLTMNAYRRGEPPAWLTFASRFRKVVVPYWGGIAFAVGVFALVAVLQAWRDGGSVRDQWSNVHIGVVVPVHFRLDDVGWSFTVFGWLFRERVPTPLPIGSLWFVPLLLQYYLLFPLSMRVLRRIGPWNFAAAAIALTIVSRALYIELAPHWIDPVYDRRTLDIFAPFRASEFLLGMSLGYLLVHGRAQLREWVSSPVDVIGLILIGGLLQWASVSFDPGSAIAGTPLASMGHVGLALFAVPLLFKTPGKLEASVLAKALTFLGVISFTALIVDDGMRYVASFLRSEGAHGVGWWFFLWVVYIPGATLVLAYPMAKLFGLLPARRAPAAAAAEPAAAGLKLQPS